MGYFTEGFGLSAGATLGSLATQSAFMFGGQMLSQKLNDKAEEHRVQHYDPTVRADLSHIMVLGRLERFDCPFPKERKKLPFDILLRHKVIIALLILLVVSVRWMIAASTGSDDNQRAASALLVLFVLVICLPCALVVALIRKLIKKGMKYTDAGIYRSDLVLYGQQYWHIREYVRQALEQGQMNVNEGIKKLCNTALVCQFPDTVEEIEANAFFFEQQLASSRLPQ